MNDIKTLADKIKNDKKLALIMLAGFVGVIFLIFFGGTTNETSSKSEIATNKQNETIRILSVEDTEKILAEKVCNIVSAVSGVSNVTAAVSVASSGKYIYAENLKTENNENSHSSDSELVIMSSDNEPALLLCINAPEIVGVAVVCQGVGSAVVREEITNLLTSLLGIGSDKIYVCNKS